MWIERAQKYCAEEGIARAVRRDTREVGSVQEYISCNYGRYQYVVHADADADVV